MVVGAAGGYQRSGGAPARRKWGVGSAFGQPKCGMFFPSWGEESKDIPQVWLEAIEKLCQDTVTVWGLAPPLVEDTIMSQVIETVREFNHRTFGSVGRAVLSAKVAEVTLNGKALPIGSVEYLLNFALQSLQDAYAGAKTEAEAKGAFDTKLDRIIAGTVGVRMGGGGVSEETKVARQVVREILRKKLDKEVYEAKYKDDDAAVDEAFAKNEAKLRPFVDERLAELKAERDRKAKLASKAGELEL